MGKKNKFTGYDLNHVKNKKLLKGTPEKGMI
jgi:hypothetical protein